MSVAAGGMRDESWCGRTRNYQSLIPPRPAVSENNNARYPLLEHRGPRLEGPQCSLKVGSLLLLRERPI